MVKYFALLLLIIHFPTHAFDWFPSSKIKPDEHIIFFPTEASFDAQQKQWLVDIHGWVFERELSNELLAPFTSKLGLKFEADEDSSLFKQRVRWFLVDNERRKRVYIQLGGKTFKMKATRSNGHFHDRLYLNKTFIDQLKLQADNSIEFHAILPKGDKRIFTGKIFFNTNQGISLISDIDDTIKISNVTDKKELLANTFKRPFKAAPGMAEFYKTLKQKHKIDIHYVSASPWHLYPVLTEFMQQQGFPAGVFHMKYFRWRDKSFFNLFSDPIMYKIGILEFIVKRYPNKQFILVGDSGEKDPEVYAMVARQFPKQIKHIYIRKVGENNSAERFEKAFEGIDRSRWQAFSETSEIPR